MSRKWKNWYKNEVDEETKGADSRDKVKHNGRSDQLFNIACLLSELLIGRHLAPLLIALSDQETSNCLSSFV